jgi:hypothetical protein
VDDASLAGAAEKPIVQSTDLTDREAKDVSCLVMPQGFAALWRAAGSPSLL